MECPFCLSSTVFDEICYDCGMDLAQGWVRRDGLLVTESIDAESPLDEEKTVTNLKEGDG